MSILTDEEIITAIKENFQNCIVEIETDKYIKNINMFYKSDKKSNRNCFNLKLENGHLELNTLKLPDEYNCQYTGTQILKGLFKVAKKLQISRIKVKDLSVIRVNDCTSSIDLAKKSILLNGESWYNKYGYYSLSHQEDNNYNRSITLNEKHLGSRMKKLFVHNKDLTISDVVKKYMELINIEKKKKCDIVREYNKFIQRLDIHYDNILFLDVDNLSSAVEEIYGNNDTHKRKRSMSGGKYKTRYKQTKKKHRKTKKYRYY